MLLHSSEGHVAGNKVLSKRDLISLLSPSQTSSFTEHFCVPRIVLSPLISHLSSQQAPKSHQNCCPSTRHEKLRTATLTPILEIQKSKFKEVKKHAQAHD